MTRTSIGRTGMVLVVVAVGLIFVTIFFATMIGRVRHETGLTARASINERLYQIATAIGRLTVRKLQRDFETYDKKSEENIMDMVFNGKKKIKDVSYDDVIGELDVVKQIREEFKSRWGELDIAVKYSVEIPDKNNFSSYMAGLENSPFERYGYISADVVVTHRNHRKHCKISKQFLLTRLFAAPFHRFTFFVSNAASIDPDKLNRLKEIHDDGTVVDADPPLQLFNMRITGNQSLPRVQFNPGTPPVVETADDLNQNGWVYLGGSGNSGEGITLKIMSGSQGKMPDDASDSSNKNKYGEYFHCYYTDQSLGWRGSQMWTQWLASHGVPEANPPVMKICYVDYGFFSHVGGSPPIPIENLEAPPMSGQNLFAGFKTDITKASALHLFGTPELCTPTLVFGKVKRKYLRIWAFLFGGNVWPLKYMSSGEYLGFASSINTWIDTLSGNYDQSKQAVNTILSPDPATNKSVLEYDRYKNSLAPSYLVPSSDRPMCYLDALVNLAKPHTVQAWNSIEALQQNDYVRDGPTKLCVPDYEFKSDENLHYTGRVNAIKVDSRYFDALKQRTSFLITQKPAGNGVLPLSKCTFFQDEFIDTSTSLPNGKKACYLNQIIGFDSSVEIDEPLLMLKGGIIWSKKDIIISKPVINPMVYPGVYNIKTPDNFGWLTLVAGGNIIIRTGGFPSGETKGYPELHAFLVACNGGSGKVLTDKPVHLIGGVAVDDMAPLIEKGGIIEWGFMRGELCERFNANGKNDMTSEDFHGLSMGPMDGEYVYEQ
ncbi:MAG TPA: hypothetical protein PLU72_16515 [Candidatus Ozemobacteraceae bacterium]|nr:hypothetical protein [Candidatus Ozemobacteraceae bacterium]